MLAQSPFGGATRQSFAVLQLLIAPAVDSQSTRELLA
jgi:hypothetical protein